VMADVN